jgi:hypothetical protein
MGLAPLDSAGGGGRARSARAAQPRRARAAVALVLFSVHLVSCVHYVPADPAALPAGADVTVGITDRGRSELREALGPGAEWVDGRLLSQTEAELVLSVTAVRHADLAASVPWAGERVAIPRALVREVQERTVDRTRTFIAAGIAVLVITLVSLRGFGVLGHEDDDGSGGPRNGENGDV